jgi:hypothetical protein
VSSTGSLWPNTASSRSTRHCGHGSAPGSSAQGPIRVSGLSSGHGFTQSVERRPRGRRPWRQPRTPSPGVWVSHLTAGRLWGLDVSPPDDIDVLVELDRRVKKAGVRSHRTGALFTADLSSCQRIPVTSPERTVVDLSASVAATALARVVDDGLRRRLVRLDRLSSCVARLPKSPGRRPRSSTSCSLIACPDTTPVTAISRRGSCAPSWPRVWPYRSSSTGSGSASGPSASTWPTRCSSWPSSSMVGSSIAPAPPSTTTGPGPTPSSPPVDGAALYLPLDRRRDRRLCSGRDGPVWANWCGMTPRTTHTRT